MLRWLPLSVCLGMGCLPEPHDLVGRACDDSHPCGSGLECVGGVCVREGQAPDSGTQDGGTDGGRDGGTDGGVMDGGTGCGNLMPDPSLELGVTPAWLANGSAVLSESSAPVRSGARSIRAANDGSTSPGFFGLRGARAVLSPVDAGMTYCTAAWIQRGTISNDIRMYATAYPVSGTGVDYGSPTLIIPGDERWHWMVSKVVPAAPNDSAIAFRVSADPLLDGGGYFFVDDVRVWVDPTGRCDAGC